MNDDMALEWYSGIDGARRCGSILFEDHAFLDEASGSQFRACSFHGHDGRAGLVNGKMVDCGGVGVVDTTTGRLVVLADDDPFRPGLDEVLAPILANAISTATVDAPTGRHVVERLRVIPNGGDEYVVFDKWHGSRRTIRRICSFWVDEHDQQANEHTLAVMEHVARFMDANPFQSSKWKPLATSAPRIRGSQRHLLPEHGDTLGGYFWFGR